jgi:hypothetical protein
MLEIITEVENDMKSQWRIEAWCNCKDQATRDAICADLVARLQNQKALGNILEGTVIKLLQDRLEETREQTGL